MPCLVLQVLPVLYHPGEIVTAKQIIRTTVKDLSVVKEKTIRINAFEALGSEYWEQNGMSIKEVMAVLKKQGFIANKPNVASALNSNRTHNIKSMRFFRPVNNSIGNRISHCRYFRVS
jgi:hypothetical protein